jgi:hypothetical protein
MHHLLLYCTNILIVDTRNLYIKYALFYDLFEMFTIAVGVTEVNGSKFHIAET